MDAPDPAIEISSADILPPELPIVVECPTVIFTDGQHGEFSRATITTGGVLSAELTRSISVDLPDSAPARVTDTVVYSPASWHSVYTAPRGALTAWTWRRDDAGVIQEERQLVATGVTEAESVAHASAWLRRYAIADSQVEIIASLAFVQRVTVSDPETIALKFYFQLPSTPDKP